MVTQEQSTRIESRWSGTAKQVMRPFQGQRQLRVSARTGRFPIHSTCFPGRTAASGDWLEPGEQFDITLFPQEGVPPYGTFIVVFNTDGFAIPLSITCTVPFSIQPVMNLGRSCRTPGRSPENTPRGLRLHIRCTKRRRHAFRPYYRGILTNGNFYQRF